jgi:hypothetical protein
LIDPAGCRSVSQEPTLFQESKLTAFPIDVAQVDDPTAVGAWLERHGIEAVHIGVFDATGTLAAETVPGPLGDRRSPP